MVSGSPRTPMRLSCGHGARCRPPALLRRYPQPTSAHRSAYFEFQSRSIQALPRPSASRLLLSPFHFRPRPDCRLYTPSVYSAAYLSRLPFRRALKDIPCTSFNFRFQCRPEHRQCRIDTPRLSFVTAGKSFPFVIPTALATFAPAIFKSRPDAAPSLFAFRYLYQVWPCYLALPSPPGPSYL